MSAAHLGETDWDEEPDPEPASSPLIVPPEWHHRASCATTPIDQVDETFFAEGNDASGSLTAHKLRRIKRMCKACPVFTECMTHALTEPEKHGVWAGTSKRTRDRILKLMAAGKTTIAQVVRDYLDGKEERYERERVGVPHTGVPVG